jgi:aspartyl-tRNA(Asn)/glutamyl-tRNA(Gln) amidotransferase subunit C
MSIDRTVVDHVARLARLALTDAERDRLATQLSSILEHINVINEAETSATEASANVPPIRDVMAADVARSSDPTAALLANAPAQEDGFFRVRAVLEDE